MNYNRKSSNFLEFVFAFEVQILHFIYTLKTPRCKKV